MDKSLKNLFPKNSEPRNRHPQYGHAEYPFVYRINYVECKTMAQAKSSTLFRMIPVTLHNGEKSLDTLAFLDEGASTTLIDVELADKLGVMGIKEQFTLDWTSGITRVEQESRQMNLLILGDSQRFSLHSVRTVENLQLPLQSLDVNEVNRRVAIMQGLPITSYGLQRPGVLIGLNNIHLIAPFESRIDKKGELVAVRCKLGWTIYGRNQTVHEHTELAQSGRTVMNNIRVNRNLNA